MLLLDCKCLDPEFGQESRPDELTMKVSPLDMQNQLIGELGCFAGVNGYDLFENVSFDILFVVSYLDSDMNMVIEEYEDTRTLDNSTFIIPYNSPSSMTITGTFTFSDCHCCCGKPDELSCNDDDSQCPDSNMQCVNSGKPTFSLLNVHNTGMNDKGNVIFFDETSLSPILQPCSDCGCTAMYSFDEC